MSADDRSRRGARGAAPRAQQRALRERLRAQLAAQLAAQRQSPLFRKAEERRQRRRRRWLIAGLLAALLLLLLARCECEDPPAPPLPDVIEPEVESASEPPPPVRKPPRPRPLEGTIDQSARDTLKVDATTPPSWLPQFRLQVAARSRRLATCFNGVEKPGALRWTALVHPRSGRVSESELEPVFRGVELSQSQHDCLVKGLSDPPFRLDLPSGAASDEESSGRRVSLIFEF